MAIVVGALVVALVVAIAAVFVIREAGRIAQEPPPALFDPDEAFDWVVANLPDDAAATLTPADVRRILDFQVEYFKRKGVSTNGSTTTPSGPVVIDGAETVGYILERCAASGESYIPEQVDAVVETQLSYLRSIGAIGPAVETADPGVADDADG
jgi:hypothetical protein